MSRLNVICQNKECGKEFSPRAYQLKIGTGKYCSRICAAQNQPVKSTLERLLEKIDTCDSLKCWEFSGGKNADGYGAMSRGKGLPDRAHRISYRLFVGDIPKGKVVMHTCDNRCCCNPAHLKLGTQKENIDDMVSKSRNKAQSGVDNNRAKLTESQVREIRMKYSGEPGSKIKLAVEYGMAPTSITNIVSGKYWASVK